MRLADRALIAATVLAVDLVTVGLPLTALLAALVLVARPAWFRRFVDLVYQRTEP